MDKETQNPKARPKHQLWDCESSLYDSFELKSLEQLLESARTMSMPRLSFTSSIQHEPPPPHHSYHSKKHSKLTRSFSKLLRSVFGSRTFNNHDLRKDEAFYFYDTSGPLSTIPEVPDFEMLLPEMKSLVRRTRSDRFMPTSLGMSCA